MSLKTSRFLLLGTVIVGIGIGGLWQSRQVREIASVDQASPGKSAAFRPEQFRMGKPNQLIEVRIDPVNGFPSSDDQEATLKATITLNRAVDSDISFQWVLPPGIELVSGELTDVIPGLKVGQSVSREISVLGFSSEGNPRNISIEVGGKAQGIAIGSTGVFRSHPTQRDLSIGFRSSKTGRVADVEEKATAADEEPAEARPALPKGVRF